MLDHNLPVPRDGWVGSDKTLLQTRSLGVGAELGEAAVCSCGKVAAALCPAQYSLGSAHERGGMDGQMDGQHDSRSVPAARAARLVQAILRTAGCSVPSRTHFPLLGPRSLPGSCPVIRGRSCRGLVKKLTVGH